MREEVETYRSRRSKHKMQSLRLGDIQLETNIESLRINRINLEKDNIRNSKPMTQRIEKVTK